MDLIFCKLKKAKKTWIKFFASLKSSKNMDFIFFIAALAKMTPKRIEVDTKNFTHVAKTISSLPKLLPHHAHALLTQQKPHKKKFQQAQLYLTGKPRQNFKYFPNFCIDDWV